jgi:hypothetical protein
MEVGELDFDQLSLNLPDCAAPQTDIEARYPGPDSTLEPFSVFLAFRYATVVLKN